MWLKLEAHRAILSLPMHRTYLLGPVHWGERERWPGLESHPPSAYRVLWLVSKLDLPENGWSSPRESLAWVWDRLHKQWGELPGGSGASLRGQMWSSECPRPCLIYSSHPGELWCEEGGVPLFSHIISHGDPLGWELGILFPFKFLVSGLYLPS